MLTVRERCVGRQDRREVRREGREAVIWCAAQAGDIAVAQERVHWAIRTSLEGSADEPHL